MEVETVGYLLQLFLFFLDFFLLFYFDHRVVMMGWGSNAGWVDVERLHVTKMGMGMGKITATVS